MNNERKTPTRDSIAERMKQAMPDRENRKTLSHAMNYSRVPAYTAIQLEVFPTGAHHGLHAIVEQLVKATNLCLEQRKVGAK